MGEKEYLIKGLKNFFKSLNKDFKIYKILLFGSRAGENFNKHSDVDLIIVSSDFNKMNFFERVSKMYDYWEIDLPVDFIWFTPSEFNKLNNRVTIVQRAVQEGIEM